MSGEDQWQEFLRFWDAWKLPGSTDAEFRWYLDPKLAKRVGLCRKTGSLSLHKPTRDLFISIWDCDSWACDRCAPRRAGEVVGEVAERLQIPWSSDFVPSIYIRNGSNSVWNFGGQNLFAWSAEVSVTPKVMSERLRKQVKRIRDDGVEVSYIAVHGQRTWWILSTVAIWEKRSQKGRPPVDPGVGTWVPAEVGLMWEQGILRSGFAAGFSRSVCWRRVVELADREKGDEETAAKESPVLRVGEGGLVRLRIVRHVMNSRLFDQVPEPTELEYLIERARAMGEARRIIDLPNNTPCTVCGRRIREPEHRRWSQQGVLCNRVDCHEGSNENQQEVEHLVAAIRPHLEREPLAEWQIDEILEQSGISACFAQHRELIEQALGLTGAIYETESKQWTRRGDHHQRVGTPNASSF